jgi:predicted CXXCH cytochrome family protein
MLKLHKLIVIVILIFLGSILIASRPAPTAAQDALAAYKNNNCVNCHSRLSTPYRLTSRYGEWHISQHKEKEIGCDKCHGGDPAISDEKKAHVGVVNAHDPQSRLHPKNLNQTCKTCHVEIANSFVESKHFQNLTTAGLGPSCNTCHAHMASEVIYTPEQAGKLCASCHDSTNALMPKRPEIPGKAEEAMHAIRRASVVTLWVERLVDDAQRKKIDIGDAAREAKVVRAQLAEAKISWHAFNMDTVRRKADGAYEDGTKLKDALRAKLYPSK